MSSYFYMKDLGPLRYFLGIEVACNSSRIYLCQWKYTLEIVSETGMMSAKPTSTPLQSNHQLAKEYVLEYAQTN